MTRLRWGVLSTARIADQLVRAFHLSNNSELVAVASRDLARGRAWAWKREVPHAFGSYDEMLASNVIDAVYIPLPNSLHQEWSIRALQQHKHVLCEKPLASNAAQAGEMIRVATASGVKLMEGFMYRFHPEWTRVRQLIADGAIGEVKLIRGSFDFYLGNPGDIRLSKELAGGSLMDVGCYPVNAARMILGTEPVAVQARAVWGEGLAQTTESVDTSLAGVLEFPNNTLATIDSSLRAEQHQWVGISGTQGHLGVPLPFRMGEEPMTILYDHGDKHETIQVPGANEYHLMAEHFADAVLNAKSLAYPPEASLKQMRVLDALYESARTGKRMELAS